MESSANHLTPALIERLIGHQRWYADKGREIVDVTSLFEAEVLIAGNSFVLSLLLLNYELDLPSTYLLVWDPRYPDRDVLDEPQVRDWLIDGFQEGREVTGSTGRLTWSGLTALDGEALKHSRVFRGEQSNTSIIYADQVMIKVFRKIRQGQNPEVEIGEYLTQHTRFRAFPQLLGTIDFVHGSDLTTLACAQQFIQSVGDAWSWSLEGLGDDAFANQAIEAMRQLGCRTAQLHMALSTGTRPDFAPEHIDSEIARTIHQRSLVELDETISALGDRQEIDVQGLGQPLAAKLDDLLMTDGTFRIRIHGDFHLGQVLRTVDSDFAILDFEGEPTRSLAERREKASPLRDVAGMLRSIDYLAETARRRYSPANPDGFSVWNGQARAALIDGYTVEAAGWALFDQAFTPDSWRRLLEAFEVHKALYETRYELGNRPDWVEIPLSGLRRLAGITL